MLFGVTWVNRGGATEESDKRTLKLFTSWQPPSGVEFKGFYDYADSSGGIAIVESNSAESLYETMAPWATYFTFTCRPIIATEQSAGVYQKVLSWRDSVR